MPMNFPTMDSLKMAASIHGFRQPHTEENEKDYRADLADYVMTRDPVESMEIRTGHGWDQFTELESLQMLLSMIKNKE